MKFKIIDHVDQHTIYEMYNSKPIFILTTGRSGSQYIVNFFNKIFFDKVTAYHEPHPVLEYFPNYFYNNQDNNTELKNIFNTSRMESILKSYIDGKIYIESNQCLVFLADTILKLFPNAKFIHLIRSPIDFTISSAKKGWYKNDSIWENGRIKSKDNEMWVAMSHIEKLAWYWNETNQHIEDFKESVHTNNFLTLKLEKLTTEEDTIKKLISFCELTDFNSQFQDMNKIQTAKINELIINNNEPKNMKKDANFPNYYNWDNNERENFISIVSNLSKKYDYSLDKRNYEIEQKLKLISTKNKTIEDKNKTIEDKNKTIEDKNKTIENLEKKIVAKDLELSNFLQSKKYKLAKALTSPYMLMKNVLK